MDRDPGASSLSVPLLGCCVNLGCFCQGYPACPSACYCRDMWQNRTPQTACVGPVPVSLHILQFGKFFSQGPRVEQMGTLSDLFLKNESCRLNCKSRGMAVVWVSCKTLPWMPFGYVPAVLNHTCNGELCTVVAIYPVFREHLMFCRLVNTFFHGSGCTLEVAVFCQHLRWLLSRLCRDVSVACESFILEKSQDLKQHALVNNLVWLLNRK